MCKSNQRFIFQGAPKFTPKVHIWRPTNEYTQVTYKLWLIYLIAHREVYNIRVALAKALLFIIFCVYKRKYDICKQFVNLLACYNRLLCPQARNLTHANGRSASGDSLGLMSWPATTASTPGLSPSNARYASGPSRGPTTSPCTWSVTCPKRPNDTRGEAGTSFPRLNLVKCVSHNNEYHSIYVPSSNNRIFFLLYTS